jgi:hypothetical protein
VEKRIDPYDCCASVAGEQQGDREDAREPADARRDVPDEHALIASAERL